MSDIFSGLANLTKSVTDSLNTYEIRKLGDKVQGYVMNFTEAETKVREATNEDPWGPTGPQMQEIAHMTFQYDAFPEIMGMLWKRMFQENKAAWRRVYKSMILLNYLLKNGSERVVSNARDHLFEMRALESYKYMDEKGKDQGINVRHRAKLVMDLIQDEELLRAERRKAKTEGKEKYQGYSKEEMRSGGMSSNLDSKWKNTSRSNDFRDDDFSSRDHSSPQREVTAFDFGVDRHQTGSPELGIRERTPELPDDDGFGAFVEARGPSSNAQNSATNGHANSSAQIVPPPIPGPNGGTQKIAAPAQPVQNSGNLLDIDFGPPPPQTQSQQQNFFTNISSATASTGNNLPRPPSGGSAQAPSNSLVDLFEPTVAVGPSPIHTQKMSNSTSLNIFDDFPAPAPQVQASAPVPTLFTDFPTNSHQPTHNSTNSLFGNFSPSTQSQSQNSIDPFVSNYTPLVSSSMSEPNFMGMQTPLAPMHPVQAQPIVPISGSQSARETQNQNSNKNQQPKLPGRWEDIGKVNIDLDNLSLRSPKKQNIPMNQMRNMQNQNNSGGLNW